MDDPISRQAVIDEVSKYASIWMEYDAGMTQEEVAEAALKAAKRTLVHILEDLPSAQPNIKDAISAIRQFLDDGNFITTCKFITKDGVCLMTDWGYFEEGLDELERYAERSEE